MVYNGQTDSYVPLFYRTVWRVSYKGKLVPISLQAGPLEKDGLTQSSWLYYWVYIEWQCNHHAFYHSYWRDSN